MISDVDI